MSLILGVAFLSLALILYRAMYRAVRAPNPPGWLQHWLVGDMLCCLVTGLVAFGLLYLAFTVGDVRDAAIGVADGAVAAVIAVLVWLVLDRLSRRGRRPDAGPLAGGPAPAA